MPRETMRKWDAAREARLADPDNPALIDAEYEAEREHFAKVREEERAQAEAKLTTERRKRQALTLIIIFAIAAGIFATTKLVIKVQHTANDAADASLEAKQATARVRVLTSKTHSLTTSLQRAVVESCQENGNARAEVQQEELHEELGEAEHPDPATIHAFIEAGFPERVINELENKAARKIKKRLAKIKIVDCAQQYHISPGSGERRRDQRDNLAP